MVPAIERPGMAGDSQQDGTRHAWIDRRPSRRPGLLAAFCWLGVAAMLGGPVRAFEARDLLAFRAGPVTFRQKLSSSAQFTDNLFWSDGTLFPKESDLVGIFSPSVTAELGRTETPNRVSLGYTLDGLVYLHNSAQNAVDHHINLSANFRGDRLSSASSVAFGFLSSIQNGMQRFEEGILVPSGKVDRTQYSLSQALEYDFTTRISGYVRGSLNGLLYGGESRFSDTLNWRATAGGTFAMRPGFRILGEVYYGQRQLQDSSGLQSGPPDLDTLGGMVGFRSELTRRLAGTAKVGYEHSEFADGSPGNDGPVFEVDLGYKVTDRFSTRIGYRRATMVASSPGGLTGITDFVNAGLQYRWGTLHPILFNANFNYGTTDYFNTDASQERFGAGASITYQFTIWLAGVLAYDYENLGNNLSGARSYSVNRVTASVILGY